VIDVKPMSIQGAWVIDSPIHKDERGYFREWFKNSALQEKIGKKFDVTQANMSRSQKGVVRGIHFSTSKLGQAKWVTCGVGAIWDVVVDIRPDSKTFMRWEGIELTAENGRSVVISEGLGHAFIALEDDSIMIYALSSDYDPSQEFAVNPIDAELAINWPLQDLKFSERDLSAPTLKSFLSV
jgi:dTDP-4-dehydrorhamnose 3,5-epimerase